MAHVGLLEAVGEGAARLPPRVAPHACRRRGTREASQDGSLRVSPSLEAVFLRRSPDDSESESGGVSPSLSESLRVSPSLDGWGGFLTTRRDSENGLLGSALPRTAAAPKELVKSKQRVSLGQVTRDSDSDKLRGARQQPLTPRPAARRLGAGHPAQALPRAACPALPNPQPTECVWGVAEDETGRRPSGSRLGIGSLSLDREGGVGGGGYPGGGRPCRRRGAGRGGRGSRSRGPSRRRRARPTPTRRQCRP